ncbi:MAG: RNA-binding protein [Leptospiraceae bacterium]|nr:RNA-binding protein [Leptospiraceae bacterium]
MKLSVGNLPQSLSEEDLSKLFSQFGSVESVHIKRDKKTNASLGYGSIEMNDESAKQAIERLNGHEIDGKKIVVVDAATLQTSNLDKYGKPIVGSGSKIHTGKPTVGGSVSTVRRSGGGGRGK